ncbi:MAG TPA: DNA polymerase IV [Thermomicrobiales bacterium]|nr:DNA polymerase IV [Thermomicrobiales bacterium]
MVERWILHCDLDAFFASAEVRRRPDLRGRPVIVGGQPTGRGVVASATYEARARGVHSAMPLARAQRLCPDAVFLPGDFTYYRDLSRRFRAILADTSPVVEIASIDEAYLDATGLSRAPGPPRDLAAAIKRRLHADTGLTVSIGVAPNKTVAKIASDFHKPDGLTVVPHGQAAAFLAPLPAGVLPGVGPKARERLAAAGLRRVGDLAAAPPAVLQVIFGARWAADVAARARGLDDRSLEPDTPAKSLGHERTFPTDVADVAVLRRVIRDLADQTARQLRRAGLGARVVTLKLRHADFQQLTRQRALRGATEQAEPIRAAAAELLDEALAATGWRQIRLLGVRVGGLGPLARQLDLFDQRAERQRRLDAALDHLHDRFGDHAVYRVTSDE